MMTTLENILIDIHAEIERLVSSGVDRATAEIQATGAMMAQASYEHDIDSHKARLLSIVSNLSSKTNQPVPTKSICAEIGADYFATYYHLRKLEDWGKLKRSKGPRSGWRIA